MSGGLDAAGLHIHQAPNAKVHPKWAATPRYAYQAFNRPMRKDIRVLAAAGVMSDGRKSNHQISGTADGPPEHPKPPQPAKKFPPLTPKRLYKTRVRYWYAPYRNLAGTL